MANFLKSKKSNQNRNRIENKEDKKLRNGQYYDKSKKTNTTMPNLNAKATSKLKGLQRKTKSHKRLSSRLSIRVDDNYLQQLGIAKSNYKSMDPSLIKQIEVLRIKLYKEKKKTAQKKNEMKDSLAMLSQTMFKKLLEEETDHYEQIFELHELHDKLQQELHGRIKSKTELLLQSNKAIDELREYIKHLSNRLQKYNV
eukprot:352021_1